MTPREYFHALRKRWWMVLGVTVLLAAAGFAQAKTTTPMYRSTTTSYATLSQAGSISELVQGSTYTQNLMQSFALLADTPAVLDPVISDLGLPTTSTSLAKSVTATVPLNTFLIEIQATNSDPQQAAAVSDAVAAELASTVQRLSPTAPEGGATVRLETVAEATVPKYPYSPNTKREVTIWGAGGALLGLFAALMWALTDTRIRHEKDIEAAAGIPVLASIPKERRSAEKPQVSEAFRRMRANLAFLDAGRSVNAIVITSPSAGEGKTTSSIALALALAEVHRRVLLIDADLRKPAVAERTGLVANAGLTNILIGQAALEEVSQHWRDLDVLTSGPVPPNPAQLVESDAMAELIETARTAYDYVVIDSPPLLPVVDATVLARAVGGAVIVARVGRTTRQQLTQAVQGLRTIDAGALGSILVGTEQDASYYGPAKRQDHGAP